MDLVDLSAFHVRTRAWQASPFALQALAIADEIHKAYGTTMPLIEALRLEVPVTGEVYDDCNSAVAAWIVKMLEAKANA